MACEYGPIAFGASLVAMISMHAPSGFERDSIIAALFSELIRRMATYPGNASLSSAVKDRVLSTFQQAVTLYRQGRSAEVVEGCTLILRMDPTFDPARKLLEKTRNPNASIDVDSLLPAESGSALSEAHAALLARDFQRAADLTSEVLRDD